MRVTYTHTHIHTHTLSQEYSIKNVQVFIIVHLYSKYRCITCGYILKYT